MRLFSQLTSKDLLNALLRQLYVQRAYKVSCNDLISFCPSWYIMWHKSCGRYQWKCCCSLTYSAKTSDNQSSPPLIKTVQQEFSLSLILVLINFIPIGFSLCAKWENCGVRYDADNLKKSFFCFAVLFISLNFALSDIFCNGTIQTTLYGQVQSCHN